MNYTNEQISAIIHDKGNILVSASAGSGKTFVMIRRLIRLIIEGFAEVDEILAVTFTNLAASEMKEKLTIALIEKINDFNTPPQTVAHLKKQLAIVPSASISTFHSFCNDLVKNYFYHLGLDASFKIADEVQAQILRKKAIDAVFEERYLNDGDGIKQLLSLFMRNRRDDNLKDMILELHNFFESEAYPRLYAKQVVDIYSIDGYQKIKNAFFAYYHDIFVKLNVALNSLKEELALVGATKQIEACNILLCYCEWLISDTNIISMGNTSKGIEMRLPPFKTDGDEELERLKVRLTSLKTRLVNEAKYLRETFADKTDESLSSDLMHMREVAEKIVKLCFDFDEEYSKLKREENVVDFSDLEHFALELLDKDEIREEVSGRYKYVFADEYQDTNGVQEEILTRISRDNLFMVGDVKQSIYAFRGCNPLIFERKFKSFENGEGTALSLTSNFRSSTAVLSCVNAVFSEIMTEETGGTEYRKRVMTGGNGEVGDAQLHVVVKDVEEEEKPQKTAKKGVYSVKDNLGASKDDETPDEGLLIATLIKKALGGTVKEKDGTERAVAYGDIVILTRSMGAYASKIAETLLTNDIPVSSEIKKEITIYPEVRTLISLLRVIDCAKQDIPLCAVMRSPIGGFTDKELALIRRASSLSPKEGERIDKRTFVQAVDFYRETQQDELKDKLEGFFEYLNKIRFLADYEGAGEVLARVIREKELDLFYSASIDGKNRIKRLNKLVSEATQGDKVYTVREYLERIDANADDLSVAESVGGDAVRIMSIHASKGLEFPVVILCGLHKPFNSSDIREEIIKDREFGIAFKTYDVEAMSVKSNIFREFLKKRYRAMAVREEMRILYVGLTRAKSALYLTGSCDSLPLELSSLDVLTATKYSKLISKGKVETVEHTPLGLRERTVEVRPRNVLASATDSVLEEKIRKNLEFEYAYDTTVPTKSSVTAILKDAEQTDFIPVLFKEEDGQDARIIGDAYHRVMELIDFNKPSLSQIIEQKQTMVDSGLIEKSDAELVDNDKIHQILKDEFFRIEGAEYFRELPFEVLIPAKMVKENGGEDEVLVQGVIDLLAYTPNGVMLVDYKVSGKTAKRLVDTYKKQLELYAYATERITGQKVVSQTLYNLKTGEKVKVN